jgi:hypothetical protein
MKFNSTLLLSGKTATGLEVPAEVVAALGAGKKPAVVVRIGGHSYRSTVASMGRRFMLPVSAENRAAAGVSAGDDVEVDLELDTAPREVAIPGDFGEALDCNAAARRFFDSLSYSQKLRHVLAIEQAKSPETRARRIEKAVGTLREGRV